MSTPIAKKDEASDKIPLSKVIIPNLRDQKLDFNGKSFNRFVTPARCIIFGPRCL